MQSHAAHLVYLMHAGAHVVCDDLAIVLITSEKVTPS